MDKPGRPKPLSRSPQLSYITRENNKKSNICRGEKYGYIGGSRCPVGQCPYIRRSMTRFLGTKALSIFVQSVTFGHIGQDHRVSRMPYTDHVELCKIALMRSGKYTLDDDALEALSLRQPLDYTDGHQFRSTNYEDALEDPDINILKLTPPSRTRFKADTPEYIVVFVDGSIIGWYSEKSGWHVPKLTMGLPHASLYRIAIFINGLRLGRESVAVF